jgi:hypothetical protein
VLIIGVHQVPSLTQERYEHVVRRLTGKDRLESTSDLPFEGLLFHAAGQGKSGFCVVDVFEPVAVTGPHGHERMAGRWVCDGLGHAADWSACDGW